MGNQGESMNGTTGGGSAFPRTGGASPGGMSMRDYFAGQALIGVIQLVGILEGYTTASAIRDAWKAADLMLAARETD